MATDVFPPPHLILGSLGVSQGQSSVNMREHRVGMGQGDSRCGVGTGAVQRGRKVREAGGSSRQEVDHHWAVSAATTAEAAETITNKHALTHKTHKHHKGLGPSCLALRANVQIAGEGQEQQGPSQTESSLTGVGLSI